MEKRKYDGNKEMRDERETRGLRTGVARNSGIVKNFTPTCSWRRKTNK